MEEQNQTVNPAVENVPVQPITPSKSNLPFILLGGVLLFAVVGSGAFLLGQKSSEKAVTAETDKIPAVVSPTVNQPDPATLVIDPTANWKTYTNNKYNITFTYPNSYFQYISPQEDVVYLAPKEGEGEAKGTPLGLDKSDVWLDLHVNPVDTALTLEQFLELPEMSGYKNAKKEKIAIAGLDGYKVTIDIPSGPNGIVFYEGLVKNKNTIYRLSLTSYNFTALLSKQTIFDQILSTFKFL